jgi:hypothetical protein
MSSPFVDELDPYLNQVLGLAKLLASQRRSAGFSKEQAETYAARQIIAVVSKWAEFPVISHEELDRLAQTSEDISDATYKKVFAEIIGIIKELHEYT